MATTHLTFNHSVTTNNNIAVALNYHGLIISYACSRGTDYQAGQMTILKTGAATVDYNSDWFGDDVGLTLTSDISGNYIRLIAEVDASSGDNITFNYNLTTISVA